MNRKKNSAPAYGVLFSRRATAALIGLLLAVPLAGQNPSGKQETAAEQTAQTLQRLQSSQSVQLLDKPIVLLRVRVAELTHSSIVSPKTVGETHTQGFWIGQPGAKKILVYVPRGLVPVNTANDTAQVYKNDLVDITGTVKAIPDTTTLKALFGLSEQQIQEVQRQGVMIEAGSIVVHSQ